MPRIVLFKLTVVKQRLILTLIVLFYQLCEWRSEHETGQCECLHCLLNLTVSIADDIFTAIHNQTLNIVKYKPIYRIIHVAFFKFSWRCIQMPARLPVYCRKDSSFYFHQKFETTGQTLSPLNRLVLSYLSIHVCKLSSPPRGRNAYPSRDQPRNDTSETYNSGRLIQDLMTQEHATCTCTCQ